MVKKWDAPDLVVRKTKVPAVRYHSHSRLGWFAAEMIINRGGKMDFESCKRKKECDAVYVDRTHDLQI